MTKGRRSPAVFFKFSSLFLAGGLVYGALELLWRGRTHWSMLLAGGVCAVFLYLIAVKLGEPVWKKWIMGGAVITTVEFVTGILVNIVLGWHVWSYDGNWGNLFGQICLVFALFWVLLSIPGVWLMQLVGQRVFREVIHGRRKKA
ncbi:hypothetical protein IZU99_04030 [Oscillospiraceae bacterium CM]|nr:hypothetical protein IZU99_04030 [Oscillospiraceae bacterium CM]